MKNNPISKKESIFNYLLLESEPFYGSRNSTRRVALEYGGIKDLASLVAAQRYVPFVKSKTISAWNPSMRMAK